MLESVSVQYAFKRGRCRACGAAIIWVTTIAGKSMPCDPQRVTYRTKTKGTERIVTPDGQVLACELNTPPERSSGMGHVPHFAACTHAAKMRKPQTAGMEQLTIV